MCKIGQDIHRAHYLAKQILYLHPVVTLWIYVLISDAITKKKLSLKKLKIDLYFYFIFTRNACFLHALCCKHHILCNITEENHTKHFIIKAGMSQIHWRNNENNRSHNSGANSMLYNVEIKGFPFSPRIFIWTIPVWFAVKIWPFATSIYLYISTNEPSMKS